MRLVEERISKIKKQLLTFTSCQRCVGVAQIRQKRVDFRVLYESEAVHQKALVPEAMARYSQPRVWWGVSTNGVTLMSGVHSNTLTQGVSASKIPHKYTHLPSKYPSHTWSIYPIDTLSMIHSKSTLPQRQLRAVGLGALVCESNDFPTASQMGKGSPSIFHFCCDSIHSTRTGETAMLYYSENWHYRKSWTQALKLQCFQGFQGIEHGKANSKLIQFVKHRPGTAKWYKSVSLKRLVR